MSIVTPVGLDDGRRSPVRRTLVRGAVILTLASVALVIGLVIFAQQTSVVVRLYLTVVGLLLGPSALNNFARFAYGTRESRPGRQRRRPRNAPPNWPADLFEIEARVSLGKVSAFDYQSRLRPLIRELAVQRLASHPQIDLSRQPLAARERLGERLWREVQDSDEAGLGRRDVPGPTTAQIKELVELLESI